VPAEGVANEPARPTRRRLGVAAGIAIAAAMVALALSGALQSARRGPPRPAALALASPAGPAVVIGHHPVGLSVEYPLLAHDLGAGRCPPAALVRTILALGSPVLRIGGDSGDEIAPAGTPPRAGLSDLPAGFWSRVACLERETRIPIVIGLNVAWGVPAWAATMAAGARRAIPRYRLRFELGNEPDIYGDPVRWWNGRTLVDARMPWATYLARARAIEGVLGPRAKIEGPDLASGRWTLSVPVLARALRYRTLDAHFYALDGCHDPTGATAALLSRQIQSKLDERVRIARDARDAGLAAVISEANSISCGGIAGVSDQPATAVWALRTILTAVRDGFVSVRFHSSGGSYDPFVVNGNAVVTRPLYIGMQAGASVLTPGSSLRAIPNAAALDGVELTATDGTRTVVVSNYGSRARWVALPSARPVQVVSLIARAPTLVRARVAPTRGRARVELAPASVEEIVVPGDQPGSRT